MSKITIRLKAGVQSTGDISATVQDATYNYLLTSPSPKIRVSAYLDRDWPMIQPIYPEIFVDESCAFVSRIEKIIPGSRLRDKVTLPGPMKIGEQLTLLLSREPLQSKDG